MAKQNIIAALDIGGGKVTAVAATTDQQTNVVKILAGAEFACDGITAGVISDIRATANTISKALAYLEENAGPICSLYLALRGKHIETYTNRGSLTISRIDTHITQEDIDLVIENAKSISLKTNFEILSAVPQAFYINKEIMKNPEDMSGSSLEVDVHITTGLKTTFDNINKAIERANWPLTGSAYGLICLAECVLTEEDKDVGALLIDMGKDTTSAGIYANNSLICSYDLDFGSDLITSDIAKCLHISHKEAENIKIKYGAAFPNNFENGNENEDIVIPSVYNKAENRINRESLIDIIRPRVENIFEVVREKIQASNFYEFANTAVLTGGGSLLPGIKEQARTSLNMKYVTCATVQNDLVECDPQFLNPKYATAVSLAYFVAKRQITYSKKSAPNGGKLRGILDGIKKWELFGD